MTLTFDLSPTQEERLQVLCRDRGIQPEDYVRELVAEALLTESSPMSEHELPSDNDTTIALLESWIAEGKKATPEEIEEAEKDLQEFKDAMNESRRAVGARLLYVD